MKVYNEKTKTYAVEQNTLLTSKDKAAERGLEK